MLAARQRRHDAARVPLGEVDLAVLGIRPRDRPLDPGGRHRVAQHIPFRLDQIERLVRLVGEAGVGVGARKEHPEPHGEPGIAGLGPDLVEGGAQHLDGAVHLAETRVRAPERLVQRRSRPARRRDGRRGDGLLAQPDGLGITPGLGREMAEHLEQPALGPSIPDPPGVLERTLHVVPGALVTHPGGQLEIEEARLGDPRADVAPAEVLQRRHPACRPDRPSR